jgi:hypothetical protein
MSVTILGAKQLKKFLDPKKVMRATRNAVNATATETRKESFKKAKDVFNLKPTRRFKKDRKGKDTTRIKRARQGEIEAVITYRGKRPGLQNFSNNRNLREKTVKSKKGNPIKGALGRPKVKIFKSRSLKPVRNGFFLKDAGTGAWMGRVSGLFRREGKSSYPITRLTGLSIKQMYEHKTVNPHMDKYIKSRMAINWQEKMAAQYRR